MYEKGGRGRQWTIVRETVCDEDQWIWHILAVSPGSKNDLNTLAHNPLMLNVNRGLWPPQGLQYTVNATVFHTPFVLLMASTHATHFLSLHMLTPRLHRNAPLIVGTRRCGRMWSVHMLY